MAILPRYNDNGLQPAASYTNANLLAANIPEIITVPTDENGKLAAKVLFNKTSATAVDFYAKPMIGTDANELTYNGTFAEFVTNGAFASDTGWTKGTGWTIAAGVATATGAISTTISQTAAITLVAGQIYQVTFDATRTAGTVTVSVGGTAGTARSTNATFKETITAGSDGTITFTGAGFSGTLDNVTVSGWTLGTGWTTDGTTAIATGAISTTITEASLTPGLVSAQTYLVTFVATRSAGSVAVSLGGGSAGTSRSTSATFSEIITAGSAQDITFTGTGFTGTLDNVSVTKCIAVPGDTTDGSAGDLNPVGYALNPNVTKISIVSAGAPIITSAFYK